MGGLVTRDMEKAEALNDLSALSSLTSAAAAPFESQKAKTRKMKNYSVKEKIRSQTI